MVSRGSYSGLLPHEVGCSYREGVVVVTPYRDHASLVIDGGEDHFHSMSIMCFELHLDIIWGLIMQDFPYLNDAVPLQ